MVCQDEPTVPFLTKAEQLHYPVVTKPAHKSHSQYHHPPPVEESLEFLCVPSDSINTTIRMHLCWHLSMERKIGNLKGIIRIILYTAAPIHIYLGIWIIRLSGSYCRVSMHKIALQIYKLIDSCIYLRFLLFISSEFYFISRHNFRCLILIST